MGVAKVGKSGGSSGVLNYALKEEHAQIIGGNVAGEKDEIKEQFAAFEDSRSSLKKNTTHITWSFAPGEEVSDEKAVRLAEELLKKLNFEKSPYLIVRHTDKEKRETDPYQHIHIIAGRIRADTSVVPDFQIARRTIEAVKELEKAHGLQQTPFIDRSEERQPKREELKMIERTGELSARLRLQEQIKEVAADFRETKQFVKELERRGVAVEFNIQKTGRIAGVSFETDGVAFKGSSLGKNYSWNGLQKQQGLNYEHERDFGACQRASQRAGARRLERIAPSGERAVGNGERSAVERTGFEQSGAGASPVAGNRSVGEDDRQTNGDDERKRRTENQTRREYSLSQAGAADGVAAITTENREVSRTKHELVARENKLGETTQASERGGQGQREVVRGTDERSAEREAERSGDGENVAHGARGKRAAQEDGASVGIRKGGDSEYELVKRELEVAAVNDGDGNIVKRDGGVERSLAEELDVAAGAREASRSIHDSSGTVSAGAEQRTTEAGGEQQHESGEKAHDEQKARAVTQAINLAYGGSLPNEVQEAMTEQLAGHSQLDDYYERTRLTRWQETIQMSQTFVEATAQSLGAIAPPPETEQERNERLKGWMQATVQVAVCSQTGRELDKQYVEDFGKQLETGYEERASDKGIGTLERLAERNGVAPPLVEMQNETRAAVMMNMTGEEIAAPVLAKEREFVKGREEQAQALEQAKQERQQTQERGGYGMSR